MAFDFVDEFLALTDSLRSPRGFRLWTAISILSAVLERRAWTVTDVDRLYPNQYIILAGSPASGKTVMVSFARNILKQLSAQKGGIYLGPDNPTKASFLREFAKSAKISINGLGVPYYSAMTVLCMELGVFISKYEKDFIADLTTIYDNPPIYTAPRAVSESVVVEAPTLNIIAAATPDALGDTFPEIAWTQGFTSRFIFVYGATPKQYRDPFKRRAETDLTRFKTFLSEIFNEIHGEFLWDEDAQTDLRYWLNEKQMDPVPTYGRLLHYCGRRNEHVMKLAMISAVSAQRGLNVTLADLHRAQDWLFTTEKIMPDVFRAMTQRSDKQLLDDAHYHFFTTWSRLKDKKPINERDVWNWFAAKAPHDKIAGLVEAMTRTGRLKAGLQKGDFIPNTFDKIQDP